MSSSVEISQFVIRTINRTIWRIPRILDGDRWRNIENSDMVKNPFSIFSYDHYEGAIYRAQWNMERRGWNTELTDIKELCIEHLVYQRYQLKCWK